MDCYNQLIVEDVAYTITSRVNDSNKFVMEIYDGEVKDKGGE